MIKSLADTWSLSADPTPSAPMLLLPPRRFHSSIVPTHSNCFNTQFVLFGMQAALQSAGNGDAGTKGSPYGAIDGVTLDQSAVTAGAGLVYVCSVCNITATSPENLQAHFGGQQHRYLIFYPFPPHPSPTHPPTHPPSNNCLSTLLEHVISKLCRK